MVKSATRRAIHKHNEKASLLCATQYITTAAPCYFVMRIMHAMHVMRVMRVMRAILPRARNLHIYAPPHA